MTPLSLARFVLVPYTRSAAPPPGAPLRRYRLARIKAAERDEHDPFAHLKRSYD